MAKTKRRPSNDQGEIYEWVGLEAVAPYSDLIRITTGERGVILTFGQLQPELKQIRVVSRVVLPPKSAARWFLRQDLGILVSHRGQLAHPLARQLRRAGPAGGLRGALGRRPRIGSAGSGESCGPIAPSCRAEPARPRWPRWPSTCSRTSPPRRVTGRAPPAALRRSPCPAWSAHRVPARHQLKAEEHRLTVLRRRYHALLEAPVRFTGTLRRRQTTAAP